MNLNLIIEIYYIGALNLYSTSYQNNKKDECLAVCYWATSETLILTMVGETQVGTAPGYNWFCKRAP